MSTGPLQILPKFLWNEIYHYLTFGCNLKLIMAHHQFNDFRPESHYKDLFLKERTHNIAFVEIQCDESSMANNNYRIKHFWLYALATYVGFDNIANCSKHIYWQSYNQPIIFKVFMKAGQYQDDYNNIYLMRSCHNFRLELIGSKTGCTSIVSNQDDLELHWETGEISVVPCSVDYDFTHNFRISAPTYFSMSYIKFDADCTISSINEYNNNYESTVVIANCIFTFKLTRYSLCLENIYNATITNCVFANDSQLKIVTNPSYQQTNPKRQYYVITDSKFTKCDWCCVLMLSKDSDITFNNNDVIISSTLIKLIADTKSSILVENNILENVDNLIIGTYARAVCKDNTIVDKTKTF